MEPPAEPYQSMRPIFAVAVERLAASLNCPINLRLQAESEAGHHAQILTHERVAPGQSPMPAVNRHTQRE